MSEEHNSHAEFGKKIDEVSLEIDYEIIDHFSRHLYGSPNKAIEELVVNGFDAAATWVRVFLPGKFGNEAVHVWDNGLSMDQAGLKDLWMIATSPKKHMKDRTVELRSGGERKIIGKFGIGKLASYTVGNSISHLCKQDNRCLLVSIDFRDVTESLKEPNGDSEGHSDPEDDEKRVYQSPIRELTEKEAKEYAEGLFSTIPEGFDEMFSEEQWTLATISDLKGKKLTPGRLAWVLGNGMPIRPDFDVWVNDEEVKPKLEREGAAASWSLAQTAIREALVQEWEDTTGEEEPPIQFGEMKGLDPTNPGEMRGYAKFPELGIVWGEIRLYEKSLEAGRSSEQGRSSGFFVMVRGRLLNEKDDKLLLHEPSFGAFYRSQFILNIDALDEDLLADRERIREDTDRAVELKILQRAVYKVARNKHKALEDEAKIAASPAQRLPTYSRPHFIDPVSALWIQEFAEVEAEEFDIRNPKIDRSPLGDEAPLAVFDPSKQGFVINSDHTYLRAIEQLLGGGQKAKDAIREFEALAISEEIFKGFLYELGLAEDTVGTIVEWRYEMYRLLAQVSRTSFEQIGLELEEASYVGGTTMEDALVVALEAMGFKAVRDGAKGKKDVFLLAPAAEEKSYRITFESKGKTEGAISNDEAEVSAATSHRDDTSADHAVIVARKFAGFTLKSDDEPAILKECRSVGGVSIMEVEALKSLLSVMEKYSYPLDMVREVFTALESPGAKLERIQALDRPLEEFDYPLLLQRIWDAQVKLGKGENVAYLTIHQEHYRDLMEFDEIERILNALFVLASPLIHFNDTTREIALRQAPERISARVQKGFSDSSS